MRYPAASLLAGVLVLISAFDIRPVQAQPEERAIEVLDVELDRWPKITARVAVPVADPTKNAELPADDVSVIEDTRPLSSVIVTRAGVGKSPVSLVLALDTSGDTLRADRARAMRETTKTFFSQLGPRDRTALVTFGTEVSLREPFTADRWSLSQRLDALQPSSGPRLADGLLRAAVEASSTPPGSRSVVLLSTGRDLGSQTALHEGIAVAARGGVPVYAIAVGDAPDLQPLQRIADETRGQLLIARTTSELAEAYQRIRSQVSSQFEVTWTTKLTADPGREVLVELKIDENRIALRGARFSYRQPPFANLAAAASGPAFIEPIADLTPELLIGPQPPDSVQFLQAGVVAGLGIAVLYFALLRKTVNQRLRIRLGSHIEGIEPRLKLNRVAITPLALVASGAVMRFLSTKQIEDSQGKLLQAGFSAEGHLRNFMAAKLVLAGVVAIYGYVILQMTDVRDAALILAVAFAGLGFFLPNLWLGQKIERRTREITRALPDALDMLSVGMSAGLSFDATVLEVADKWHNPLTEELELTMREMRLGASRRDALTNLAYRTNIEDIRMLVTALVQADELGTSLADTLNIQADQLRLIRKHRAEEQAHKAAVKMLIPLVALIFPALFVVILGPAVPKLFQSLGAQ
ncbi:MAG: type II secretion system F family protein [Chloroflexota bacterium]